MEGVGLEVVLSRSWRRDAEMSAGKCGVTILCFGSIFRGAI